MLFVKDKPSRLDDVREMIAKVDVPVRQVMIEARIVEAGDSFAKNLGIRLNFRQIEPGNKFSTANDNIRGNSLTNSAVNLPATPRAGQSGTLSLLLFNSALTQFLSAEISALEADGRGKVISSP